MPDLSRFVDRSLFAAFDENGQFFGIVPEQSGAEMDGAGFFSTAWPKKSRFEVNEKSSPLVCGCMRSLKLSYGDNLIKKFSYLTGLV